MYFQHLGFPLTFHIKAIPASTTWQKKSDCYEHITTMSPVTDLAYKITFSNSFLNKQSQEEAL